MNKPRAKVPDSLQADVLVQCRRRCCICFGLKRDDEIKKGQIAHLDGNRNNNNPDNLAFLCFEHHDEFDSKTSQSKGLTRLEVGQYRSELLQHFGSWSAQLKTNELLSFLASQCDLDAMVEGAIKVGGSVVFYGEEHAFDVLVTDNVDYCDADLYIPHLVVLDHFASWGWLTYEEEEREMDDEPARVFIRVDRKPICDDVANKILARRKERGEDIAPLMNIARHRSWKVAGGER